ncbi:PREDICTED: uncharacterized protein LOC106108188 [Papilio polytes]|uniref:uncharacterized protein LOC106108188 n=1 Tax=Papilio polytes TaxID=76194 RepID=UPI000675E8DD|nr:PREDICTED: uncharacterized protein LOC106108188 [Papilio polytes]
MVVLNCSAGEVNEEVAGFKEDQDTELLCMKQQAIALLETCCEDTASAEFDSGQAVNITGDSDKPRRTRRRVRRRKRHLSAGDSNGGTRNGETNKDNIENFAQPILENNGYTLMEEKGGVGDLVNMFEHVDKAAVKDNLADTRKARIIHSISPTQT